MQNKQCNFYLLNILLLYFFFFSLKKHALETWQEKNGMSHTSLCKTKTLCARVSLRFCMWYCDCVFVCLSVTPPYPLFHGWAAPSAPGDPQTDTVGCAALWLTLFVCVCVHGCVYACVGTLREFIPPANFTQSLMLTLMPTIWVVTKKWLPVCLLLPV